MRHFTAAFASACAGVDSSSIIRGMTMMATALAAITVVVLASFGAVALGLS